jgi:hypothetical protein
MMRLLIEHPERLKGPSSSNLKSWLVRESQSEWVRRDPQPGKRTGDVRQFRYQVYVSITGEGSG